MKKILVIERDTQMNHLYLDVFKEKYKVDFVNCIDGVQNLIDLHQSDGGLEYYDVIIMDPYFSHYPLYDYDETLAGMQTGWFVYRDFMKNLTSTVIIWTHPIAQYNYNESNYPERAWGRNVAGVFRKDYTTPYLLELVERYARVEPIKNSNMAFYKSKGISIPPGFKCSVCGVVLSNHDFLETTTNSDCQRIPLDDFVGLTVGEILKKLNERLDGIYSLGPSDHPSYDYIARSGNRLHVSIVKIDHKECSKE